MGHGDAVEGIIARLPKVKAEPNFEPVRALPEGPCFDLLFAKTLQPIRIGDAGESTPEVVEERTGIFASRRRDCEKSGNTQRALKN
jgi:hypothetical protein